ncbi:DoxX family protein [Bacillus sinesaloumensis]|uniref:DoxX family protein n=1 Tax=Litchfieldia sinesaloumensis TaxID=1926280 RepID=UPI0009882DFF|nr:DoxX family protein [Bacillus sinesaloumensis]
MNKSLTTMNLIRYVVAYVFIISGAVKLFTNDLHSMWMTLPIPTPDTVMYVVAILEVVCGILIAMNKEVKKAVIPLLIIMVCAILLTKIPVLHTGLLQFAFAARLDFVLLVLLYILYKFHHK